ncbi:MAG: hypothetical protein CVU81_02145 [Euryarchaeota archaeon HGW-Euryarchaeota-1]|nr:MAG: hypothetical protein CVU81_02145 [Euryarchaeota archaeon HGW-Euryarchaeota-1]
MLLKKPVQLRAYQQNILAKILDKNSLVILPTGTGKTLIALALAVENLKTCPLQKILIMAPTKPLVHQHFQTFSEILDVKIVEITGRISASDRKEIYEKADIIIATPQTIENDLITGRLDSNKLSLVVFDEAHHAVSDYSYVFIAKFFQTKNSKPLHLGLTASPGSDDEKINAVISNLFIKHTEIRSENDKDIVSYIMKKQIEWRKIELPESFLSIKKALGLTAKNLRKQLQDLGFLKGNNHNKKDLLMLQSNFRNLITKGNDETVFRGLSLIAGLIKTEHIIELLETQGISSSLEFFDKLKQQKSKAAKSLFLDDNFKFAYEKAQYLASQNFEHPKLQELVKIIEENNGKKIIIFSQYRSTVDIIMKTISASCSPVKLIGQKEGMTQKEQEVAVEQFRQEKSNALVCTSVGEEGLDIPGVDLAVFFEAVPSEIRAIQRAGRVARHKVGKIIILLAKDTRDEVYFWSAHWKKKQMEKTIDCIRNNSNNPQKNILDFVNGN